MTPHDFCIASYIVTMLLAFANAESSFATRDKFRGYLWLLIAAGFLVNTIVETVRT